MAATETDHKRNPADQRFLSSSVDEINPTLSDGTDQAEGVSRGLSLDAAGDITYVTEKGSSITRSSLAVGVVHPIRVRRVKSTGTTIANTDIFLHY